MEGQGNKRRRKPGDRGKSIRAAQNLGVPSGASPEWDGRAPHRGWHWLRRKRKGGGLKIAFSLSGGWSWRISDSIGRTTVEPATRVRTLFDYVAPVESPER